MISKKSQTYAQALSELSSDTSLLTSLKQLCEIFTEQKIMAFFLSRVVSVENKKKLIASVLKSAPSELKNFFFILLEGQAFVLLPQIVLAFQKLKDKQNRICRGFLFSPHPLLKDQKQKLEDGLQKFFNKKIELQQKEDKNLIGGFLIDVGGFSFNNTVLQDLKRFQNL